MRWFWAAVALWIAWLAGGAAIAGQVQAPHIDYRLRVLANGLRVYSAPDHARPKVNVQLWYAAGSRNDPVGRTGLAHLTEHLMFKGRGDPPPGYLERLTESVGGDSNASTAADVTEYDDTLPPAELERVLWAEAARMMRLNLTQSDLDSERTVVERELIEDAADDPAAGADQADIGTGALKALHDIGLADVVRFRYRYYRPDNAVLIVVGDFDPVQLDLWIDRYFAAIARPGGPLPQTGKPWRLQAFRAAVAAHAPTGDIAIVLGFTAPDADNKDAAALTVLDALLTGDDDARGYTRLVDRGIASDVFSLADPRARSGMFYFGAMPGRRSGALRLQRALGAVLADLKSRPVGAGELRAAKNQLLESALEARETIEGVGGAIGSAAIVQGDAAHVNSDVAAWQRVTAADVQRAARRYLRRGRAISLQPGRARENASISPSPPQPQADASQPLLPEPASGRLAPSAPAALPVQEAKLSNGLRVIVARSGHVRLATAVLVAPGGGAQERPDERGSTKVAAEMMSLVCGGEARRPAKVFEALGLSVQARVDADTVRLSLTGLSTLLERGLRLLASCVRTPLPGGEAFGRARRRLIDMDEPAATDIDAAADDGFDGFGPRPHVPSRAAVVRRAGQLFRPSETTLVLAGDVDPAGAFEIADRLFGARPRATAPLPGAAGKPAEAARRGLVLVDAPGYPLALVVVGARTPAHADSASAAFELADSTLGGSFTSRLSEALRDRRGLTYDVSSQIEWRRDAGLFTIRSQVDPAAAAEAVSHMVDQIDALARTGPTATELAKAKMIVAAKVASATDTTADLADLLADQAARGEPAGAALSDAQRVAATDEAAVRRAAAWLADPANLQVVIVADVRKLPPGFAIHRPRMSMIEMGAPPAPVARP